MPSRTGAGYSGITSEPSLLSGSVTVVGEIVYSGMLTRSSVR
ncbi:MAG: hypothetical protein WBV77_11925 [Solirubrobacteraceae bacterium]